jgi:hypothetical protein
MPSVGIENELSDDHRARCLLKWILEQEHEPDYCEAIQLQQVLLAESIEIRLPTL